MKRLVNLLNLILVLSVSQAWALSSDREQPINIESDTAELNEKTGVSTYRGRVVLTQGTLVIHSDTLVIYTNEEDIERVVAQGNPATYQQTPDGDRPDIHAQAKTLEYRADGEELILREGAQLEQDCNTYNADIIRYDTLRQIVTSVPSQNTSSATRTSVTIQPRKKQSNEPTTCDKAR